MAQHGFGGADVLEFLAAVGAAEFEEAFAGGADHALVTADGVVVGAVGAVESLADVLEVVGEFGDAAEEFGCGFGDGSGVLGLIVLLPTDADGAEQCDEGGRRREQDAAIGGPDDQIAIALQRGAEE